MHLEKDNGNFHLYARLKPSGQISLCPVTDVKYYNSLSLVHHDTIVVLLLRLSGISL